MKTLKFIFWNFVAFFMAIAGELTFYPFGGAGESFVDENGITCININVFRYIVILMLYFIMDNKQEDYIEDLVEENYNLKSEIEELKKENISLHIEIEDLKDESELSYEERVLYE